MAKPEQRTLTTGDLARLTGVPQQTLIAWDRDGVLRALPRGGKRARGRTGRRYDEAGLIAGLFARYASFMGFRGEVLKDMIRLVQAGERKRLEAAALVTYRTGPGLMKHYFTAQIASDDVQKWLADLHERDGLVEGPTTLWTIREYLRPTAHNMRMGEGRMIDHRLMEDT